MNVRTQSTFAYLFLILLGFAWTATSQAQGVEVNSADPDSALQGTIDLDVEISGSGFDNSAAVDFFVTGTTNPGGISVKKVKVRGPKKIIATIDVDMFADVDDFDIEVRLSSGRNGKGTTLFKVQQNTANLDPCLTSTTFPTFAYWDDVGTSSVTELKLSDAEGACTQTLTSYDTEFFIQGEMKMHYEPPTSQGGTGTGRIVWEDNLTTDIVYLQEFTVAADNTLVVTADTIPIVFTAGVGGSVGDIDIAGDGDSLAFSHHWADVDGDGLQDGESLYTASIAGCLLEPWLGTDPTPCNGTSSEILSFPAGSSGSPRWTGLSWNHDGTRIYLQQSIHAQTSGIYSTEETSPGVWDYSLVFDQLATYNAVSTFPAATLATWDSRGDREVLAFRLDDDAPCAEIFIIDVEDCRSPGGQCGSIGPESLLGRVPSWTSDGYLLFNELSRRGKHQCRNPGEIAIIEPFDAASNASTLVDGRDPDG